MSAELTKIINFISLIQLKADAMKEIKVVLQHDEPNGAGSVERILTCLGSQGLVIFLSSLFFCVQCSLHLLSHATF